MSQRLGARRVVLLLVGAVACHDEPAVPPHEHHAVPDKVIGGAEPAAPVDAAHAPRPGGARFVRAGQLSLPQPTQACATLAHLPACFDLTQDEDTVYFAIASFDDAAHAGVYSVPKGGGSAALLFGTPHGEEAGVIVDGADLYIARYYSGVLTRQAKAHGRPTVVLTDQAWLDNVIVDGDTLYWYAQKAQAIRRRAKRGGPIATVAEHVEVSPFLVHDHAVYWFAGPEMEPKRLLRRGSADQEPTEIARDLVQPALQAEGSDLVFSSTDTDGVFAVP